MKTLRIHMNDQLQLFDEMDTDIKLRLIQQNIALVIIVLLCFGPYGDFYVDMASILRQRDGLSAWLPNMSWQSWLGLRFSIIGLAILALLNILPHLVWPLLIAGFWFICFYVKSFSTFWNYNTHLIWFGLFLWLAQLAGGIRDHRLRDDTKAFVFRLIQWCIALIYFNAGCTKIWEGGLEWIQGDTIYSFYMLTGPHSASPLAAELVPFLWLFPVLAFGTLLFEIGFIFVFVLARRAIPLMALIGLLFHALIHTTMSIPFFHLWSLYPTIFFIPWWLDRQKMLNKGKSA